MSTLSEAEAALLAMGSSLRWMSSDAADSASATTTKGQYKIRLEGTRRSARKYRIAFYMTDRAGNIQSTDLCPKRYKQQTDARTACEYHLGTGYWSQTHCKQVMALADRENLCRWHNTKTDEGLPCLCAWGREAKYLIYIPQSPNTLWWLLAESNEDSPCSFSVSISCPTLDAAQAVCKRHIATDDPEELLDLGASTV